MRKKGLNHLSNNGGWALDDQLKKVKKRSN